MSTLEEKHVITLGEEDPDEAAAALGSFFELNGYETLDLEPGDEFEGLRFTRGKPGHGWWATDLTRLHTRIALRRQHGQVILHYQIDTRGQRLTSIERSFWQREAKRAEQVVHGKAEPTDLRPAERLRAAKVQKQFRTTGASLAILVFVILSILVFLDFL